MSQFISRPSYQEPFFDPNQLPEERLTNAWWRFFTYLFSAVEGVNPSGTIVNFAGSTAPDNYLICDGSSYTTSQYPNLFSAIGYTYGGEGENFNVPTSVPAIGIDIIKT